MVARRLILWGSSVVSITAVLGWLIGEGVSTSPQLEELVPENVYALQVDFERSQFDLKFGDGKIDDGKRYVLIIGSLGDGSSEYGVSLTAEAVARTAWLPARRLVSLRRPGHSVPTAPRQVGTNPASVEADSSRERPRGRASNTGHQLSVTSAKARDFYIHVTDGALEERRNYARVTGRVVGDGREIRVYLDRRQKLHELAPGLVQELVDRFDDELIPALRRRLGSFRDVDGDGKFTVLLTPWLSRLQGGKTSLGGFVRGSDFRNDLAPPFSNRCDMMFLNSNLVPGPHLKSLLAHEYTHAVCFSQRLPSGENRRGLPEEEDWLNEAIAHLSENQQGGGWSNLDYRISRFLSEPSRYPLVIGDYYSSGLWRNHGCRGATYLFLRWCVDQFGDDLLRKLVQSPFRGTSSLKWATGVEFEELFRSWAIAMLQSGLRRESPQEHTEGAAGSDIVLTSALRLQEDDRSANRTIAEASGYRSLKLRGQLSNWGLAGPYITGWDVDTGPRQMQIKGTALAFVELTASRGGPRRIHVKADFGTGLQLSLMPLPPDWPDVSVAAVWASSVSGGNVQVGIAGKTFDRKDGARLLQIDVATDTATGLHVEMIACECNQGNVKQTVSISGEELQNRRQPRKPNDRVTGVVRYQLPIPAAGLTDGEWIVKVVARDAQGRCAVAWSKIKDRAQPSQRLRIARLSGAAQ